MFEELNELKSEQEEMMVKQMKAIYYLIWKEIGFEIEAHNILHRSIDF